MKWLNIGATYSDLKKVRTKCKIPRGASTWPRELTKGIKGLKLNFSYNHYHWTKISEIDKHLNSGGALIFCYRKHNMHSGHYIFIHSKEGDWYNVENAVAKNRMHRKTLVKLIKNRYFDHPSAWYINK